MYLYKSGLRTNRIAMLNQFISVVLIAAKMETHLIRYRLEPRK